MPYTILLPTGGNRERLDIVDPSTTAVQRALRREGLAGYEPPTMAALLSIFERLGDRFVFFDIGANVGLYAAICSAMFKKSVIHAFEPTPSTADIAAQITKANNLKIQLFQIALGNTDGHADLHLSLKSDSSNSMVQGFKKSESAIRVQTARLDSHVAKTGVLPGVIKIDVETFEPQVLAGALSTLRSTRPFIVIEVLNRRGHDHGIEINEAMDGLNYHYYQLSDKPTWEPQDRISGIAGSANNDWLLTPEALDDTFMKSWARWRSRITECGSAQNSTDPVTITKESSIREFMGSFERKVKNLLDRT